MAKILQMLLLFVLFTIISAAVNPHDGQSQDDAEEVLEELERQIYQEVVERETGVMERTFTPKKCCKIGRRVASKRIFCNIDLFQVKKKDNTVQREKMKFHGPESEYETTYKNLMMKVEKCFPSKASRSMYTKCCQYQEDVERNLDECKSAGDREQRRQCRRRIKSRE